jgi:hypothetical protein
MNGTPERATIVGGGRTTVANKDGDTEVDVERCQVGSLRF